jgi:hypothetical protein
MVNESPGMRELPPYTYLHGESLPADTIAKIAKLPQWCTILLTRDQPAVFCAVQEVANSSGDTLDEAISRLVAGRNGHRFACAAAPGMSSSKIVGISLGVGTNADLCFREGASFGEDFSHPSELLAHAQKSLPNLRKLVEGGQVLRFQPDKLLKGMLGGDPTMMVVESCDFSSRERERSTLAPTVSRGLMGGVATHYGSLVVNVGTSYMIMKIANGGGSDPGGSNTRICVLTMFGGLASQQAIWSLTPPSEPPGTALDITRFLQPSVRGSVGGTTVHVDSAHVLVSSE